MKHNKGDDLVATFKGELKFTFVCPMDGMCKKMLKRWVVMQLGHPNLDYIFIPQ